MRKTMLGGAMLMVVLFLGGPALAQQYPPASTTTTAPATTTTTAAPADEAEVRSFGVQREGQSFTKRDCGFRPGATATATFNGSDADTALVGSDGCVSFTVEVDSGQRVRFNGRQFVGRCGNNDIVVRAPSTSGANRTVTNQFSIDCAAPAAAAAAEGGVLPRTGLEMAGYVVIGGGLIAAGAFLVLGARRRRSGASA